MRWIRALFLIAFVLAVAAPPVAAADPTPPFTLDKSLDFKPVGLKGHEGCYVAQVGKGVLVTVMYGTGGPMVGKLMAMELLFAPEAYEALSSKPAGFQFHDDLKLWAKHFYAHDAPHEAHMEHGKEMHPPGHK